MIKPFTLLTLILLALAPAAKAEIWFTAGSPLAYSSSGSGRGVYNYETAASFYPSGMMVHASILPWFPAVGISQAAIDLVPPGLDFGDETASRLSWEMVDLLFDLSGAGVNFLLGYGWGFADFTCEAALCQGWNVEPKESNQFTMMLGVPYGHFDFHVTLQRVFAKVRLGPQGDMHNQVFEGMLSGVGVKIGF